MCKCDEIGRVTTKITRVTNALLWIRRQKLALNLTEYRNNYWTDLHQRFSIGRRMYVWGLQNLHKFSGSSRDVAMVTN